MFAPAAVPVVVTSITFTSIAFILVVTRIYTRFVMLKNAGPDDYVMVGAMVSTCTFDTCRFAFDHLEKHFISKDSPANKAIACINRILHRHFLS